MQQNNKQELNDKKFKNTIFAHHLKNINPERHINTNNILIYQEQQSLQPRQVGESGLESQKQYKKIVYLPGYLRFKFKNFISIDIENLTAQVNAVLVFNIYYGDILQFFQIQICDQTDNNKIVQHLMKQIRLIFSRGDPILLSQGRKNNQNFEVNIQHKQKQKQIKFNIRKIFQTNLNHSIFLSPFQVIYPILQITILPIELKLRKKIQYTQQQQNRFKQMSFQQKKRQQNRRNEIKLTKPLENWTFKINFMDHQNHYLKISCGEHQQEYFGHYKLAKAKLRALYSNQRISDYKQFYITNLQRKQQKEKKKKKLAKKTSKRQDKQGTLPLVGRPQHQQKDRPFQFAMFCIPVYKQPYNFLVTFFIPQILLQVLNILINFQGTAFVDRLASIITILLSFFALFPIVRSSVPRSSTLIFAQILIFLNILSCFVTLLQSFLIMDTTDVDMKEFLKTGYLKSVSFWFTIGIPTIILIILLGFVVAHKFFWLNQYEKPKKTFYNASLFKNCQQKQQVYQSKKRHQWGNQQCDRFFQARFRAKKVYDYQTKRDRDFLVMVKNRIDK